MKTLTSKSLVTSVWAAGSSVLDFQGSRTRFQQEGNNILTYRGECYNGPSQEFSVKAVRTRSLNFSVSGNLLLTQCIVKVFRLALKNS